MTSTHQQSLADTGLETRPPMLERGSYVPWSSRFRRYIDRLVNASKAKRAAKIHDPLALVANTYASSSFSRSPPAYYVTHPASVIGYKDDYQGKVICDDQEDSLTTTMICYLLRKTRLGLFNEQNEFLLADAYEVEEFKDLNATVCMMARIQQTGDDSKNGPIYDSEFISEVSDPSMSFINKLYSKSDHEQTYHEQPKIIKPIIGDDQINSDIIFDDLNVEVNDERVEQDKNAHDQRDYAMELLAKNVQQEAEKNE
ncbi:hypothetical protein Tco_1446556 [Tanacetum coccineum]